MRELKGHLKWIVSIWLTLPCIFQLYTAFFGILLPRFQRGIYFSLLMPLIFILIPASKKSPKNRPSFLDVILAVLSIIPHVYIMLAYDRLVFRIAMIDTVLPIEKVLTLLVIGLILEATRRAVVSAMSIIIGVFIAYLYIAPFLSGIFWGTMPTLSELADMVYLGTGDGIYGSITGVMSTFVSLFIIFGAFMQNTKTGEFFTKTASSLAGSSCGGPAKIAVISSGLFGSISGAAAANVYATGTFTIPLMKRLGYEKTFAGAVEASASTGGMLMPPIMGVGAFVMSEITGIPYIKIVVAAILGAILYYISIGVRVHFVAKKNNLAGVSKEEQISAKDMLKDSYLLIPLIAVVALLVIGYSPFMAATWGVIFSFLISFFNKETRMTPRRLFETFQLAGRNMIMLSAISGGIGIIVSVVTYSGLALGIATVITTITKGMLLPALILIMLTSLVLGMGMPCTPAYVIAITIGGPALLAMGIGVQAAHLFVFYFAILAGVTPPICVPTYCAAAIAGSNPMRTGYEAFKLAILGFVVPFIFIYNKALLMQGTLSEILSVFVLIIIIAFIYAAAVTGFMVRKLSTIMRVVMLITASVLVFIAARPDIAGFVLAKYMIILLACIYTLWLIIRNKLSSAKAVHA